MASICLFYRCAFPASSWVCFRFGCQPVRRATPFAFCCLGTGRASPPVRLTAAAWAMVDITRLAGTALAGPGATGEHADGGAGAGGSVVVIPVSTSVPAGRTLGAADAGPALSITSSLINSLALPGSPASVLQRVASRSGRALHRHMAHTREAGTLPGCHPTAQADRHKDALISPSGSRHTAGRAGAGAGAA